MTARISVNGELRVYGRAVEIIVKPRWTDADLEAAAALEVAPVRITIEPADATPEEAPHGSPLDYLAELTSLLAALVQTDGSRSAKQTEVAIRRCLSLANTTHLAALNYLRRSA
jgi:hypothetical protein